MLIIRWLLGTPRTRDWWSNTGKYNANPDFVDFVDQEMRDNSPTRDSWRLETNWARH